MRPSLLVAFVLCTSSGTLAAPLPRIITPRATSSSQGHWELRPSFKTAESRHDIRDIALQSWADPHFYSYVRGKFDPERPYIQVVLPSGGDRNDDDMTRTQDKPKYHEINRTENGIKLDIVFNSTNNSTAGEEIAEQPLAKDQAEPLPYGAYELAYVVHRRRGAPQRYPLVQYADYQMLGLVGGWGAWGEPQVPGPLYEPVYIYRPVYPSKYHDYDVLYYVPVSEDGADENNGLAKEASEIAMPDAEHDVTVQIAMPDAEQDVTIQKEPADEPGEYAEAAEEGAVTQEENNLEQALAEEQSEELSDDSPAEGLAVGQSKEVEEEKGVVEEESENPTRDWEKELQDISDEDLLMAVEGVLQRLHNRLTD